MDILSVDFASGVIVGTMLKRLASDIYDYATSYVVKLLDTLHRYTPWAVIRRRRQQKEIDRLKKESEELFGGTEENQYE